MNVTINTDASYNPDHKIGAYAFWIVSDQGKILHSGPLQDAKDALDAEMKAIGNAFTALCKSSFTGVKVVYLNSDCIPALHQLFKKVKKPRQLASVIIGIINQVGEKYELGPRRQWLRYSHVKAHSGRESSRKWVNDWCDRSAKEQMRMAVIKKTKK